MKGEKCKIPISELSNELTAAIDTGTASDIVKFLCLCDKQIFRGWQHFPSIYDKEVILAMDKVSAKVAEMLENSADCAIVLSGCGTSGRLAFLLAQKFSQLAKALQLSACYSYLIAGGDISLFTSQEASEDDWEKGQVDLMEVTQGKKRVLYIGITCGLSAPYVAGQLDYCMIHSDVFTPVLLGFNPVDQARWNVIEGWNKSFYDVANALKGHINGIIINPVVGPEPITGSSRMKGGTATKVILESIFLKAHCQLAQPKSDLRKHLPAIMVTYEHVSQKTYCEAQNIARAIELAAESLRCNGHIYYLGWGLLGFMGLLDASECIPTFSANTNDVRGFVCGDYSTIKNRQGQLFIYGSQKLSISLQDFQDKFLPDLTSLDTVVFILPGKSQSPCNKVDEISKLISQTGANMVGLLCEQETGGCELVLNAFHCVVHTKLSPEGEPLLPAKSQTAPLLTSCLQQCHQEVCIKWILNAISTGAHILKGKVLRNYMIDLKVSNIKLFYRAISIVSNFARVSEEKAMHSLLRSIYRGDLTEVVGDRKVSDYVRKGSTMEQVVPLALLLATDKFDIQSGLNTLKTNTVAHVLNDMGLLKD